MKNRKKYIPKCRFCNKLLFETEEEARSHPTRDRAILEVYKCKHLEGFHRTSKCKKCKKMYVYGSADSANIGRVANWLQKKKPCAFYALCKMCGNHRLEPQEN